jgi:hypothetical protein
MKNHGVGGILPHRLMRLFCQDFLQYVKPVKRRINQNKLEAYPAMNFRYNGGTSPFKSLLLS